jgi:hypothetical protein
MKDWYSVSKLLFSSSSSQSYSSLPYCTISFSLPSSDSPFPFPCHQLLLVFCALHPSNRDFRASLLPYSVSPDFCLSPSGTLWAIISQKYLLLKMSLLRAFLHSFPYTYGSLKALAPPPSPCYLLHHFFYVWLTLLLWGHRQDIPPKP